MQSDHESTLIAGSKPESSGLENDDFPALDEQLCFALYTATHHITRAYRPLLEPLGLTYVQYLVMLVLWEEAPRSVGELGQVLYLDSGTLTPLLKRMEKTDVIARQRDTNDERRVLIHLTDRGSALQSEAAHIQEDLLCRVNMTRAESKHLQRQVMQLVDTLEAD